MEYTVNPLSPVQTQVTVTVPAQEVTAALTAAVGFYRAKADIKGFRKGKVPASLVESRFKKEINEEAASNLVGAQVNKIIGELAVSPLSRIDLSDTVLVKDEPMTYTFSFEHAPEFELPAYKGLAVDQEGVKISDVEVNAVVERLRRNLAELKPIAEDRQAADGDVVSVSFEAFSQGEPVPGVHAENFEMTLGEGQALPDFENLVKTLSAGQEGEGEMTFPVDFLNKELAGKTVIVKVMLHSIKERILPPIDDEMAKKAGNFESVDKMRETIIENYTHSREDVHRSAAQKKLLDGILEKLDIPLPQTPINRQLAQMLDEYVSGLERQGMSLESSGKTLDELKKEMQPQAEQLVKAQIFLAAVADKEELSVSPQELDAVFYRLAAQSGQNPTQLKQYYEANNLVPVVRDRLLADKASDFIYANAAVNMLPAKENTFVGVRE